MNSSKSKKVLVYIIMGLLSLAGIVSEIIVCTYGISFPMIAETIVTCLMFVLVAYYAVANFKVPHGNLLKYLFLAYSAMCFVGLIYIDTSGTAPQGFNYALQISRGAVVIISTYVAGRLDRIKNNTVLIIIAAILLLASSVGNIVFWKVTNVIGILFYANFFILWLDLMIAYLFRYQSHKEAGLAEK